MVGGSNLSDAFIDTVIYAAWETDEIIGRELGRNLALAMVCVFVVSLVMLANLFLTVMTLVCVVMTLVDVIGFVNVIMFTGKLHTIQGDNAMVVGDMGWVDMGIQ